MYGGQPYFIGAMNCLTFALKSNVFTIMLSLIGSLSRQKVLANVFVVNAGNNTIASIEDFPTNFGPKVPSEGLWGHHVFVHPADACTSLFPPPSNGTWFAVILHNHKCLNIDKVLNAQVAGFQAAIIYLNGPEKSYDEDMSFTDTRIKIPSTVVMKSSVPILLHYQKDMNTHTVLLEYGSENAWMFLVIGVSGIIFVILCSGCVAWLIHICCGRKKTIGLLSRWKLKKLAVHTYQRGDTFEVCAICLEDYQAGDKLRILPCAHAFHCKCVDVWLTENKKTCPLCNKAVDSKRRRHINEHDDERRPLLSDDDQEETGHNGPGIDQEAAIRSPRTRRNISRQNAEDAGSISSQSIVEVHTEPSTQRDRVRSYGSTFQSVPNVSGVSERNQDSTLRAGNVSVDSLEPSSVHCDVVSNPV